MTDEELQEKIKAMTFWGSKKSLSIEDIVMVQPGLAQIMPEIGARTWKLFYAAKAGNWPMAKFQYKEIKGLMEQNGYSVIGGPPERLRELMVDGIARFGEIVKTAGIQAE